MIRWIILLQAIIYLTIMPLLRASGELGYHPPVIVGLIAILAFVAGAFVPHRAFFGRATAPVQTQRVLGPRPRLWLVIIGMSLFYDLVSVRFGLLNRRQGSEAMADLYATMPLWALGTIRIYEFIFIPLLIVYMFSEASKRKERVMVLIVSIMSLPFMGLSESRGRIIILALTFISFVSVPKFLNYCSRHLNALVALMVVGGVFSYFSAVRSNAYYSFEDYLQVQVFKRLDGLNIVSQLRSAHLLPYWGSWDINIFSPLISKIPFLEAAQAAKMSGITSSKQYFLQGMLKSTRLDDSSSMINDPLYMGGILGMIVAFAMLGIFCAKFDRYAANRPFSRSIVTISLALAFATSFIRFEADFFGALTTLFQAWVIIFGILFLGCRYYPAEPESCNSAIVREHRVKAGA